MGLVQAREWVWVQSQIFYLWQDALQCKGLIRIVDSVCVAICNHVELFLGLPSSTARYCQFRVLCNHVELFLGLPSSFARYCQFSPSIPSSDPASINGCRFVPLKMSYYITSKTDSDPGVVTMLETMEGCEHSRLIAVRLTPSPVSGLGFRV